MIIDPISVGVAGLSTVLGMFQSGQQNAARQQEYLNQSAYANATAQFNRWQSGMNQQINTLNGQYKYWAETVQYNQQLAYTNQLRNYEFAKEIAQAERVGQARSAAGTNFVITSEALQNQLQERGLQEAVAMQQYQYRALQASSTYQAMAQEGQSMDRFVRDFARQAGDFSTLQQINRGLEERQYRKNQLSAITKYLNEYNSQQFYEPTPYVDPIAPFPPLPSMVMPAGPSMTGSAPRSTMGMDVATSLMGGVNSYLSTASSIKQLKG